MTTIDLDLSLGDALDRGLRRKDERRLLDSIQGNILRSNGRPHLALVFAAFSDSSRSTVGAWVGSMAASRRARISVTSALDQRDLARRRRKALAKGKDHSGETFASILLTSTGCSYFGLDPPPSAAFQAGMVERGVLLGDPAPDSVSGWYSDTEFHAVFVIAHSDERALRGQVSRLHDELEELGRTDVVVELGRSRIADGRTIEPFGFADAFSNPDFLAVTDPNKAFDLASPLGTVLVEDGAGGYGSFVVYRKLAQDVEAFEAEILRVTRMRVRREPTPSDVALTEAMVVGRFKDGTPLVLSSQSGGAPPTDDFDYSRDPAGVRCPFHAHIRKTNPRGGARFIGIEAERRRRIARRGIPYGSPGEDEGLLFIAYQADLESQFERIQRSWAGHPSFPRPGTGLDPLIGLQMPHGPVAAGNVWPPSPGEPGVRVAFESAVSLQAGAYLYAPSMPALQRLA